MNSTTTITLQQIASHINPNDLNNILHFLNMALTGSTTESQQQVMQTLQQLETRVQTYIYFLYIFLNHDYDENLRQITGITMKSALQRNSKELHFQQNHKNIMKAALLRTNNIHSQKLKSIQNILISQLAICFEQVDWQLIYYLIQNAPTNSDILPLISTIFEDLKHNRENYSYFEGTLQTQIIETLFKNIYQVLFQTLSKVNFMQQNSFVKQIKTLTEGFKLIKIVTFHLPLKLAEYLQIFINQIAINFLKTLSICLEKIQIHSFLSNCNLPSMKTLLIEFFQSINQISQTKAQYLLENKIFLEQFIIYFPINCQQLRKHFHEVCKIWTNVILELLINDKPQETEQSEQVQINYEKLKLFNYVDIIFSRIIVGFRFTKHDLAHISQQMQLEHNPYNSEQPLNKEEGDELSDDESHYEGKQVKMHGSTLRRVSITCMQKLCQQYQDGFWPKYKSPVCEMLNNESDYKAQQSAIVCIGIIAENCQDDIKQDAIEILQYLFNIQSRLSHDIVLTSTLWAVEKLIPAYIHSTDIKKAIYELIYKVMGNQDEYQHLKYSKNLMVKEAAVSLLDQLLSQETEVDLEIVQTMLRCLIYALESFTGRALFNVFKAISSIFQQPERQGVELYLVGQAVKHLCLKWSVSLDKDSIMCPLIQCLSYICQSRKKYFISFSTEILQQIHPLFKQTQRKSLLLRVIDLATSIIIASKQFPTTQGYLKIKTIVSSQNFLSMVNNLLVSQQKQVRHFGYGLLSDIVKLGGVSDQQAYHFIQTIGQSMDRGNSTSINNALMCITQIIDTHRQVAAKHTRQILQVIVEFILKFHNSNLPKLYLLNFSRMFGRLACVDTLSAGQYCVSGKGLTQSIKEPTNIIRLQVLSIQQQFHRGLIAVLNQIPLQQLATFMQTKQIETFLDSFMGYRYNLEDGDTTTVFMVLVKRIKSVLQSRNITWQQYLHSTLLYPASIQKLNTMSN